MNNPLVSICIPTYNQTAFLKKTLDSVFIQDFTDYEIIVSDDSTTDDVEKLVQTYPQEKITYFRNKPSLGSPANWNKSIAEAHGTYIKILHHDDWLSASDSLSKFVSAIQSKAGIDFVFCASHIQKDAHAPIDFIQSESMIRSLKKNKKILLTKNIIGAPSATLFTKSSLQFDEKLKWLVDVDFYMQIIQKNNFVFIPEPLIYTTDGATHQITNLCRNKEIELKEWFYIFNKYSNKRFSLREMLYLLKIMYRYKISSIEEVEAIEPHIPYKKTVACIIWKARILRKIYEKNN